ncbi:microtubule associated protein-domain-containing protein [Cunninghamella echinulata]|nr:microtubule associated protein-domain-containing protein [Cunninghamella echinulata]
MEHFYNKVSHLEKLWSDLGTSLDSSTIADKLKQVLHELDTVIQYEEWRKHLLSADIEDLMASIEKGCEITGITIESLLMKANKNEQENYWDYYINGFTNLIEPTLERKKYLKNLNNRLYKEIQQRKYHVKKWLKNINQLCQQLEINSPFDHYTEYYNKLNWATVQKISCTLRDLNQKYQTNKAHFEYYMYAIDYYWNILGIQEQDQKEPMDMAIYKYIKELNLTQEFDIDQKPTLSSSSLFIASYDECNDNSNEVTSNSAYLYYQPSLPFPLSISDSFIMSLQQKVYDLELLFDHRRDLYHKYVNNLHEIWVELRIPDVRKCTIHKSYKEDNLIKLQTNYDEMKNIVRILMEEYIETIQDKLTNLWDECLFTQKERDSFMEDLYERSNTMDDLHLILDRHLEYLDRIVPTSKLVAKIMKQRKELIQKMIAFETSASDPKRLFRASFQLMEEERWRKTCFPTLLELDDALIKAVKKFERISEKHFMVGDRRYLDILMDEIADRAANQTFFGFLNTEPTEERPVRIKSKSKSLYTYSSSTNVKYDKRVKT